MKISVLAAQFPVSLSIRDNLASIRDLLGDARPGDIALFPEGSISGYGQDLGFLKDLDPQELAAAQESLRDLAQELGIHLWVGCLVPEEGFWFNAAFGFTPAGGAYQYRKVNLANHERGLLTPGQTCRSSISFSTMARSPSACKSAARSASPNNGAGWPARVPR